ncbi:hypothetical protein ACWD6K_20280, partial [Streptomyces sp. NPDC002431]
LRYWMYRGDPDNAASVRAGRRTAGGSLKTGPSGPYWNVNGCGYHQVRDRYAGATAHGNAFQVVYLDGRWDEVRPWTSRGLDENNLVTVVNVIC